MGLTSPLFRQWSLLQAIGTSQGQATIKSLVAATGMSEKTIRRDVTTLRQVGFPIEEQAGEFGRKTFTISGAKTPQLQFGYDEALALYLCRRAAASFGGTFVEHSLSAAFSQDRSVSWSSRRQVCRNYARSHRQHAGRSRLCGSGRIIRPIVHRHRGRPGRISDLSVTAVHRTGDL